MKGNLLDRVSRLMWVLPFVFITTPFYAQPSMQSLRYRTDYVKESHLLRKGDKLTVLKLNLEWPVCISGLPTTDLHKYLCKTVFDSKDSDYKSALASYLNNKGKEIQQMPNDSGLSVRYVNLSLQGFAWEKDKYISMRVVKQSRGGDQEFPDTAVNYLFTYDVVADKVLQPKDILVKSCYEDLYFRNELAWKIMNGLSLEYFDDVFDYLPDGACIMPMGLLFNAPGRCDDDGFNPVSVIEMDSYISRRALKTWKGESKPRKDRRIPFDPSAVSAFDNGAAVEGAPLHVYEVVDSMPSYHGDLKEMMRFLKRQVSYPKYEELLGIEGRVTVSFIVEPDGTISSPSVISPVSPGIDRQAVEAVMSMPRWNPGKLKGVPVRTRTSIPVYFKMEKS